jgi:pilus assembly protein Flp/PilA
VKKVKKFGEKFLKWYLSIRYSERGATAVEYAIMVALIAVVIITAVSALGTKLATVFQHVTGNLPN